jgi:hypothetical protein
MTLPFLFVHWTACFKMSGDRISAGMSPVFWAAHVEIPPTSSEHEEHEGAAGPAPDADLGTKRRYRPTAP